MSHASESDRHTGEGGTTPSVVVEHFRAVERTWKRSMCWVVIDQRNRTIAGDMSERTARRVARLFNEDDARGVKS